MKTLILTIAFCITSFMMQAQTNVDFFTTMGNFRIHVLEDSVPISGGHFLTLVDSGVYDGMLFHRVAEDWVIQAGEVTDSAKIHWEDSTIVLEIHDSLAYDSAGVVGWARTSDPNSASTHFFITLNDTNAARLTGDYAIFGSVTAGMETVYAIEDVNVNFQDRPYDSILICKAIIQEEGIVFDALENKYCFASVEIDELESKVNTYPNPFKEHVVFELDLEVTSDVVIKVYNSIGIKMLELKESNVPSGQYTIRNSRVNQLPQGTYIYTIQTDQLEQTGQIIKL